MKIDRIRPWRSKVALAASTVLLAGTGIAAGVGTASAATTPFLPPGVNLIAGANRWTQAINVAKATFPGATTAILASGANQNELDAVLAAPLATALKAPILLTQSASTVGSTTVSGLKSLGIQNVILVGAAAANATAITSQLPSGTTVNATYGDATPTDTAAALARALAAATKVHAFSNVFVVSDAPSSLADAVSAAPAAAMLGAPLLLAPSTAGASLPAGEAAYVDSAGTVYLIGAATSANVSSTSASTKLVPIVGATRSFTLTDIDQQFAPNAVNVFVANGENNHLAMSLTAAPLVAEQKGALLYMYDANRATPQGTASFLANTSGTIAVQSLTFLGPPSAVPTIDYTQLESSFAHLGSGVATATFTPSTKTPAVDTIIGVSATVTSVAGAPVTTPITWSVTGSNSSDGVIESTGADSANFVAIAPGTYTISAAVDNATETTTITVAAASSSSSSGGSSSSSSAGSSSSSTSTSGS